MPLVFLATQGVSRHNEAVGDRHRSRVTNRKIRKVRPRSTYVEREEPLTKIDDDFVNIDDDFVKIDYDSDVFMPQDVAAFSGEDDIDLNKTSVSDDEDEDLNEFCNNNNDLNYNLNKLSQSTFSLIGSPVDAFPPSLIKWPLDNSIKSKRLAVIRKQVKHLSTTIKMTMDSDPHDKLGPNHSPFSSHVDMALVRASSSTQSTSNLPSLQDLNALLNSGNTKESKDLIRESNWGMDHSIRKQLWKEMVQQLSREEFSDFHYWDTVQQIYGSKEMSECNVVLPAFLDQKYMTTYCLSSEGIKACQRVISVIAYNFPAITYAPLVYPLTALLMHYMEEPEVYNCMAVLLSKSSTYISQTKILHEAMWRTVEILAKKHVRGSYSMLNKFGLTTGQIDEGFQNWTWWMFSHLPAPYLIRILDCFLLEGSKILLRCSLAIFHLFMKQTSRDSNLAAALTTKGMAEAMAQYCQNISVSPSKVLKTAFGIRALSKNEIKKLVIQAEMVVKGETGLGATCAAGSLLRSTSLEGLPTSESQENLQTMSHTLAIKELLTIWSWIPMRMTMNHPKLVYTTQEHGCTLSNFYLRVDKYEPTLLLVRTTNDEIFGAYCSTAWNQRNQRDEYGHKQTYFGTGETFLFTLKPHPVRYEWVGITKQRENAELGSVAHQSELFMHADNEMVTVGGGHGHGLMLDHDLRYGKTETCETFNNPPLCSTPDFEIKVVEVFSLGEIS